MRHTTTVVYAKQYINRHRGGEKEVGVQLKSLTAHNHQMARETPLQPASPTLGKGILRLPLSSLCMIKNMKEDFRALPFTAVS